MQKAINLYKRLQRESYITSAPKGKYAFVGIGSHSISNLYPVISYLRCELKYIITHTDKNAELIKAHFKNVTGTSDLDMVLNDSEISGIFISASPKAHFDLVKKALKADKNVFVEKPPCLSSDQLKELIECEKHSKGSCFVGLQKRYSPVNIKLKNLLKKEKGFSYNYRYTVGCYPEGDPLFDLFIHPVSLLTYLFKEVRLDYFSIRKEGDNITILMNVSHPDGKIGCVELSTGYTWFDALEKIEINTSDKIFEVKNGEEFTIKHKQGSIMNIPLEKLFGGKNDSTIISHRNNSIPVIFNNQIYTSGYFSEVFNFINHCENKKSENHATLSDCIPIFDILERLRK